MQLVKHHTKSAKLHRSYDFLTMSNKDALDHDLHFPSSNDATTVADDDDDNVSIVLVLKRLYALHKLLNAPTKQPATTPKKSSSKNVYEEEYKVKRIMEMQMNTREPLYRIKWEGYEELTWEPVAHIYDCKAFEVFSYDFITEHKAELQKLWTDVMDQLAGDTDDDSLEVTSDSDALAIVERFDYYKFQSFFFQLCLYEHNEVNQNTKSYQYVHAEFIAIIKHYRYYVKRLKQLQLMHAWLESINLIDKSKNLRLVNSVDFELPPFDEFTYTNDVIARDGIIIPNDPPVGCECTVIDGECSTKSQQCCPNAFDSKFAYTKRGVLRVPQGTPIFECNKRCSCSDNCSNRVVQKGRKQSLSIFKTSNGLGWGVRTDRAISKGQYVCEYVGEIISSDETERRGQEYDARGRTYLFDLDFNEKDNPFTIDAAKYGNVSRFLNHSCNPNVGVWAVWTDCLDLNLPKLCMFTLRSIKEDEELTFDYMNRMNGNAQSDDESEKESHDTVVDNQSMSTEDDSVVLTAADTNESIETTTTDNDIVDLDTTDEDLSASEKTDDENRNKDSNRNAVSDNKPLDEENTETDAPQQQQPNDATTKTITKSSKAFECKCGAVNCRKVLFF